MRIRDGFTRFNRQTTCWLRVLTDVHLTLKVNHNQCMKIAQAAEAKLGSLTGTYRIVQQSVRAIQVACVRAVAQYRCDPGWGTRDSARRDDLHLPLN